MTDSATAGYPALRDQEDGTNNGLWGGYTDQNLDSVDRLFSGLESYTISGAQTVTVTNYSALNAFAVANVNLTGPTGDNTLGAAAAITMPSLRANFNISNNTGQDITFATSSGTSVISKNGFTARIATDGTNYFVKSPSQFATGLWVAGKIKNMTAGTDGTDAVNKTQMEAAIAVLVGTSGGLSLVSSSDTTANYLNNKLVVNGLLKQSLGNAGGNETLNVETALYTASGTNTYAITPSPALSAYASGNSFLVLFTNGNSGASTLNVSGLGAKALTKNGASAVASGDIPAGSVRLCAYDGTRFQLAASIEAEVTVPPLGLTLSTAKTSGFTAVASNLYPCTFSSSGTITFPSSATVGDAIGLSLGDNTKTYTLDPNGLKVNGGTGNIVLPSNNTYILTYNSTAQGWV